MRFLKFKFWGNSLFFGSLALVSTMYWPHYQSLYAHRINFFSVKPQEVPTKLQEVAPQNKKMHFGEVKEEAGRWGVDSFFSVVVPKIGASANVIMNVDPGDKSIYREALKKGVAHAKGSSFPGRGGATYLFAHSTDSLTNVIRFNAVFYRLSELESGDEILIFYSDRKYSYQVSEIHIAEPTDTAWLKRKDDILILQTCWPPGTSSKRLLVIAKPLDPA